MNESFIIKCIYSYMLTKLGVLILDDLITELKKLFYNVVTSERWNIMEEQIKILYEKFNRKKYQCNLNQEPIILD